MHIYFYKFSISESLGMYKYIAYQINFPNYFKSKGHTVIMISNGYTMFLKELNHSTM